MKLITLISSNKSILILKVIKWLVIVAAYAFIVYKLLDFFATIKQSDYSVTFNLSGFLFLLLALVLMPVNWGLDAIKWQLQINRLQKVPFIKSFFAVMSGVTVSIFLPNRVGEFGGRVLCLQPENRIPAISATVVGSISQFLVTMLMGFAGVILFYAKNPELNGWCGINAWHVQLFGGLLVLLLLACYFYIAAIFKVLAKIPWFKKRPHTIEQVSFFSKGRLLNLLLLSIARYFVFSIQFLLLLWCFKVDITVLTAFYSISIIYVVMALVPTNTLMELGIRGSVALFVLGMFSSNSAGILIATLCLWVINLAIPAIIGSVNLIKLKH